jgi:hypothetical protein
MKKKYILAFLLFFVLVISTYYITKINNQKVLEVKEVFENSDGNLKCKISKIEEEDSICKIKVYYPLTNHEILNSKIKEKLNEYIAEFKKNKEEMSANLDEGKRFELNISFNEYEYNDYVSYEFNISKDLLGAHPTTNIWTITYNIKENKLVYIEDLISKNKDILNILSEYTYEKLKENPNIKEFSDDATLKLGTNASKENFSKFAFSKEGFIVFFEKYSIAPYVAGDFIAVVPYSKIKF